MKITSLFFVLLFMAACAPQDDSPEARYRRAVVAGLESEEGPRETVLGVRLGTPGQAYFDRCTELNRQQLVTMGGGGKSVDHRMPNDLDRPATLTFWPTFIDDGQNSVQSIETKFQYDDWAPWNPEASADSLLPQVTDYIARDLDLEFLELNHARYGRTMVNVTGNRLIAFWVQDKSTVKGMFTDLSTLEDDPLQLAR